MSANDYIVVFKDSATDDQIQRYVNDLQNNGGEVTQEFGVMKGFTARIPDSYIQSFQADFEGIIDSVEQDSVVTVQ